MNFASVEFCEFGCFRGWRKLVFLWRFWLSCWSSCCLVGVVTGFLSLRVACCRGCCHFSVLGVLGVAKGAFGWFRCVIWFWGGGIGVILWVCGV